MKKVLIGLYGLPRTFKQTSKYLFDNIIEPNKDKYEFDIFINTDFTGKGLTAGRPDTNSTGYSSYNYNDFDLFKNDLLKCYNINNQVKDISVYNFDKEFCNPWFLYLKRIESILIKAYELGNNYDYYCFLRMDIILNKSISLDILDNKLLFITNILTRPGFIHNRDIFDGAIIANNIPFMKFIQFFIKLSHNIVSKHDDFKDFFSLKKFNDTDYFSINKDIIINDIHKTINNVIKDLKLYHSSNSTTDSYLLKDKTSNIDIFEYYKHSSSQFHIDILIIFHIILQEHKIILSENLKNPLHFIIIR